MFACKLRPRADLRTADLGATRLRVNGATLFSEHGQLLLVKLALCMTATDAEAGCKQLRALRLKLALHCLDRNEFDFARALHSRFAFQLVMCCCCLVEWVAYKRIRNLTCPHTLHASQTGSNRCHPHR